MINHVAVIDIGKTNAKLALVDTASLSEIDVRTRPNSVLAGPPYPRFDIDGIWDFVLDALAVLHAAHRIDAISVTAHGASIALLDNTGLLACPLLDYEHDGPDDLKEAYDRIRPPFDETGSPRLAMGLNVGAQLFWLLKTQEGLADRVETIVTYPQFWSGRLTGIHRAEFTSLGCHTDIWSPRDKDFSALVDTLGLRDKMAPLGRADECLGTLLPEIARRTGLPAETPVFSGIHDSNASLLPHLLSHDAPFSVVSTGTWVISMAIGGRLEGLDPARDTLVNVNANGHPTPSARFMGGREFERMTPGDVAPNDADVRNVLDRRWFLLPAVEPGTGPFAGRMGGWTVPRMSVPERSAALAFYLALMTAECLALVGADGEIIVEGPFARNPLYLDMLAAATTRPVLVTGTATGTSIGAALLATPKGATPLARPHVVATDMAGKMRGYASAWRQAVDQSAQPIDG